MPWLSLSRFPELEGSLGSIQASYRLKWSYRVLSCVWSLILALAGLVLVGIAIVMWGDLSLFLAGVGVTMSGYGLWEFTRIRRRGRFRVLIHEGGFLHLEHDRFTMSAWEEIEEVLREYSAKGDIHGIAIPRTHLLTHLRLKDGIRHTYSRAVGKFEELSARFEGEVTRRLLPKVREQINAGERVPFGRLFLSKHGISDQTSTLRWEEVERIENKQLAVVISERGNRWRSWSNVPEAEVTQLPLFLALSREILSKQAEGNEWLRSIADEP